jgi:hypothetical protein
VKEKPRKICEDKKQTDEDGRFERDNKRKLASDDFGIFALNTPSRIHVSNPLSSFIKHNDLRSTA